MSSLDERPFPTAALAGAGLLILTTLAGVGAIQLQKHFAHVPLTGTDFSAGQPLQTRTLRFIDQKDGVSIYGGHVQVIDAKTGAELPQLRDRDGFIRAVLNSLAYQRTKKSIQAPPVFELARWPAGRITITDPATGAGINVGDFGPGNKAVFQRFFETPAQEKIKS